MNELHLFAGAGGGILGGVLLGHTCVCAVEIEPYCRDVLLQRQRDGILPWFPIWDDVRTFDGTPWCGKVDIVCGGFPCQDVSIGNPTGKGIDGDRSGLWSQFSRIVGEIRPDCVMLENSPRLTVRGATRVFADLAAMGYVGRNGVLGASDVGGNHKRLRFWSVAHSNDNKKRVQGVRKVEVQGKPLLSWHKDVRRAEDFRERPGIPKPFIRGTSDGVANWVDRLKAIGNGQVPAVVELAWKVLS